MLLIKTWLDWNGRRANWKGRMDKKDITKDAIPRFKNLGKTKIKRLEAKREIFS